MVTQEAFGSLVRRYRRGAELTQEALAERAGLSVRAVRAIEAGTKHRPRQDTVQLLLAALAVPAEEQAPFLAAAGQVAPAVPASESLQAALAARAAQLLTILIADIRGYTRYSLEQGDEAAARLAERFAASTRAVVEGQGGTVLELRGDEVLAVFSSTRQALQAALALQKRYRPDGKDGGLPLGVGMGLDAGEVVPVQGGYRGRALNLAARLCSLAAGGEVLVSDGVLHLAGRMEGIAWVDRGPVALKGFPDPVRVIQIGPEGELPPELPPLQPILLTHRTNLPDEPTPFIGREREIAQVAALLQDPHLRLLTLTGPGGIGKTRLALQVATTVRDAFRDGVYVVSLASLNDPDLVVSAIAGSVGVREAGGHALRETLNGFLRDQRALLVLDNFEHLLAACSVVADLLDSCPRLTALVTSRAVLHLAREHTFEVPPLAAPDLPLLSDLETIGRYDAVKLFCDRAQAARADFALTAENARPVVEICQRLDGLPLAIELAAARIRLFPPRALRAQLTSRLGVLTGGARDVPIRHRTLRGAIDWSFTLLDEGEQKLFARLAVFAGGCTLQAAEAVCNSEGDLPFEVLEGLSSLVDKSLLIVREQTAPGGDAEVRFAMLETIREYARERMMTGVDAASLRRRHAAYCARLAEEAEPALVGPAQVDWLARLDGELDNLRAALGWATESEDVEVGLRLAGALWRFWYARGHLTEGRKWLGDLLALAGRKRSAGESASYAPATVKALIWAAALAADQGDYDQAAILAEEGLARSRAGDDRWGAALALNVRGNVAHNRGDYDRAVTLYEEGLALFRDLDDRWGIGLTLNNLGAVARDRGDVGQAVTVYEQSLAVERELGDLWSIAVVLDNLGEVAQEKGEHGKAVALHEESLALRRELEDIWGIADSLSALALAARHQDDCGRAASLYEESLTLYRKVGDRWRSAVCLEGLAWIAHHHGQVERAARLLGAASALRDAIGHPLSPTERPVYERDVATVRAALGEEAFGAAWAAGRVMALERVDDETVGVVR